MSSNVKDSWEHRKARMQPQHSRMEDWVFLKLHELGVHVQRDIKFCIQNTEPDGVLPNGSVYYLDGEKVHRKRQDKDTEIRELLRRRHRRKVVSVTFKGDSQRERERCLKLILEALK